MIRENCRHPGFPLNRPVNVKFRLGETLIGPAIEGSGFEN
ncbi:hypothetical protein D1AOALGA4SA_7820 [Olavius algarvensis Delta 1 endosymbiont]|nr:hypothetical protein D1AOALGA4SA_7820 [Olavius algarvensis Delta 1 endosymbiont]